MRGISEKTEGRIPPAVDRGPEPYHVIASGRRGGDGGYVWGAAKALVPFLSGAEWPDDSFDYQGILPLFSTDDSEAISIS